MASPLLDELEKTPVGEANRRSSQLTVLDIQRLLAELQKFAAPNEQLYLEIKAWESDEPFVIRNSEYPIAESETLVGAVVVAARVMRRMAESHSRTEIP